MSQNVRIALAASAFLAALGATSVAGAQPSREPARLVIEASVPDALLSVDGEPLAVGQRVVEVSPGQHTVTAELRDGRYWDAIVDVSAGRRRRVTLGPQLPLAEDDSVAAPEPAVASSPTLLLTVPASEPTGGRLPDRYPTRRLDRTWGWVGLGVSTALAVTLVALALETRSLSEAYQREPTQERFDQGTALKSATEYGLLPATLGSLGLTVLAFVLSAPAAE